VFSQSPHVVLSDETFTCVPCYFNFVVSHSSKGPGQPTSHHTKTRHDRHLTCKNVFLAYILYRSSKKKKRNKKQDKNERECRACIRFRMTAKEDRKGTNNRNSYADILMCCTNGQNCTLYQHNWSAMHFWVVLPHTREKSSWMVSLFPGRLYKKFLYPPTTSPSFVFPTSRIPFTFRHMTLLLPLGTAQIA
jgi:hypothetical protein